MSGVSEQRWPNEGLVPAGKPRGTCPVLGRVVEGARRVTVFTRILLVAALAAGSVSCALIRLDPVTAEEFNVVPIYDPSRTVTFLEPMVFLNAPQYRATKGVRLPNGTYVLEAENEDFLYFRSPAPVEMRVLEKGVPVDGRDFDGGLALSKVFVAQVPAAVYVTIDQHRKMHVMKMGSEFLRLEGRVWEKNF
ncbi:MAG: hypothetical protein KatS3mg077_2124 [Candidatus Binatia bacterium]|nr:MAG: hypothetical protein KatS3mg015_3090 [Fimbriimonadales bacterium]GIW44842.1 MAG: hypothetical protein KatS3mg077_2124 [Candidatus Binatia bacterium]